MGKPLKKSFSMEFFLRARQWRDVAEFERKELLKVRVYRSLRQASAALLSVAVITVIFRYSIDCYRRYHIVAFRKRIILLRVGS